MSIPVGNIQTALEQALASLNQGHFQIAQEQAQTFLDQHPQDHNALYILGAALRGEAKHPEAISCLQELCTLAPDFAQAQQELGFALAATGQVLPAIYALQQALKFDPKLFESWKVMGEMFLVDDDLSSANEAFTQHLLAQSHDPVLIQAVAMIKHGKLGQAETILKKFLYDNPTNVVAIRALADIAQRIGRREDAENLLVRALQLKPDFYLARLNYAQLLKDREKLEPAMAQIDLLLEREPNKFALLILRGAILIGLGDFTRALPAYEHLLKAFEPRPMVALSYGHALKTVGRIEDAVASYRHSIALRPSFGDAYWSMANLKTFRFEDDDITAMRLNIEKKSGGREDHFHLCFALGKALDDRGEYAESFRYYKMGNDLKIPLERYSADATTETIEASIAHCTPSLFAAKGDCGDPACDPIFIVGMPRAGSTLLEQIIASHSQVDGTKELVEITAISQRLNGKYKATDKALYPAILADLSPQQLTEIGQEYMQRTRVQRGDAAYFIDKSPNNFNHIGMIGLILPNAKIIDARRKPMACCLSNYVQLFARGQPFTYGLENIARYYSDYLQLMDHWDEVLPGKVLRVQYEEVVADIETQATRIMEFLGLDLEQNCLDFFKSDRPVKTASSEQVRQPIYTAGLEHWRHFEPYLDELKQALGPVLNRYPLD